MSKQRRINTNFWSDPFIQRLTTKEKLLFLYFCTNDHANIAGVYEITIPTICFETGLKKVEVDKIVNKFQKAKKVIFVESFVIIKNFIKNQTLNDKVRVGIKKVLDSLPQAITNRLCIDYRSLCIDFDKYEPKPKPKLEPKLEPKPEPKPEPKATATNACCGVGDSLISSTACNEIIQHFKKENGCKKIVATPEKRKQIRTRCKNFSVAEIKQAITNRSVDPWQCGENDKKKEWRKEWDPLFRNDGQIEKWLNKTSEKPEDKMQHEFDNSGSGFNFREKYGIDVYRKYLLASL